MKKTYGLISFTEPEQGSPTAAEQIQRITEDYTSKVNALIEEAQDDFVESLAAEYAEDLRRAGARDGLSQSAA